MKLDLGKNYLFCNTLGIKIKINDLSDILLKSSTQDLHTFKIMKQRNKKKTVLKTRNMKKYQRQRYKQNIRRIERQRDRKTKR